MSIPALLNSRQIEPGEGRVFARLYYRQFHNANFYHIHEETSLLSSWVLNSPQPSPTRVGAARSIFNFRNGVILKKSIHAPTTCLLNKSLSPRMLLRELGYVVYSLAIRNDTTVRLLSFNRVQIVERVHAFTHGRIRRCLIYYRWYSVLRISSFSLPKRPNMMLHHRHQPKTSN